MSLCGFNEKGDPSEEEFERNSVKYKDVSNFHFHLIVKMYAHKL